MTITFRNTFRDRLAFAAHHLPRNPFVIVISFILFLLVTFGSIVPAVRETPAAQPVIVRAIAFVLIEVLLLVSIIAFWAVITVLTMISRRNKPLTCEKTITLAEDAFRTESEYGTSEARWTLIQKLVRTRGHIIMYVAQASAIVIPRRAFASSAQCNAFYDYCRQRTTGVNKSLQPPGASSSASCAGGGPGASPPPTPPSGACG
jgi:hypothetical protein